MSLRASIQRLRNKLENSPELTLADSEIRELPVQNKSETAVGKLADKLINDIRVGTIVARHACVYYKRTDEKSIMPLVNNLSAQILAVSLDVAIERELKRWW